MSNPVYVCVFCKQTAEEVCHDGACRACHVLCSWEECETGTYEAKHLLAIGRPRDEILRHYPNAILDPEQTR